MEKSEFIDFETIRSSISFRSPDYFLNYLNEVFCDLLERLEVNKNGLTKLTFYEYMKVPVFISDRLFNSFDKDSDGQLNSKEFTDGLYSLYLGNFEETAKVIFNMYDYNKDTLIQKGDVKVLLSYLPLKKDNPDNHVSQMEGLNELEEIINSSFGSENSINFKNFLHIIENVKSDIYLLPICFLYLNKPFQETKINLFKTSKKKKMSFSNVNSFKRSETLKIVKKRFPSPKKNSKFSSVEDYFISLQQMDNNSSGSNSPLKVPMRKTSFSDKSKSPSPIKKRVSDINNREMIRMANQKVIKKGTNGDLNAILEKTENVFNSPSNLIKDKGTLPEPFSLEPIQCCDNYEDEIFMVDEKKKLSKFFIVLVGKEISIYYSSNKTDLFCFHNLSCCFIKEEEGTKVFDKVKYYSFSIIFSKSLTRVFYIKEKETFDMWIEILKKAIGYQNFKDIYEIKEDIGSGKFGEVRLGTHKHTGTQVAIKILKKSTMSSQELELVKTEIDLMKLFRHPNIVRLLDHFENIDYIYIVMEYLSGGDLFSLVKQHGFLTEKKAAKLIYNVALGISYLNSFGIVHRDLKPENIMLIDKSENSNIKIIDFGMTKTVAPDEKMDDRLGTINYVAPEVLKKMPYTKQIDIWSLGVILYVLLSGIFPFSGVEEDDDEVIKKTLNNSPDFPDLYFKNVSKSAIRFINQCLEKDPNERITIEDFIKSEWIRNNI